ncbi:MAG: ATP synthase F0 subunit B [Patescibacteria group bacterium]|nr:ATP synthase F0 subunit B [Patescibacteria group bacterium]
MQELLQQLGIDWRLLLSQAVNFGLLLVILWMLTYKPLLRILKEREAKIKEGLAKAEEAEVHLREAHTLKKEKLKEAETEALALMQQAEARAHTHESKLIEAGKLKEAELIAHAQRLANAEKEKIEQEAKREAVTLVKAALIKTVELDPKTIDDALVAKAVTQVYEGKKS